MTFVVIEKRDNDRYVIYDAENKGMCCCSLYTLKQILDAGHQVLGVKNYNPNETIKAKDIVVLTKAGTPAERSTTYPTVDDTKRSLVTILKGLKPSREEKAQQKAILAKRAATHKANVKEAKLAKEEAEKQAKAEAKRKEALRKELEINYRTLYTSKATLFLTGINICASEYHYEHEEYRYQIELHSPAALTNLNKLCKSLRAYADIPDNAGERLRKGYNVTGRLTLHSGLDGLYDEFCQVFAGDSISLSFSNAYEGYDIDARFRYGNAYRPEASYYHCDESYSRSFGPTACHDESLEGYAHSFRKQLGRPKR